MPSPSVWSTLTRVHDAGLLGRIRRGQPSVREQRGLGLPWSPDVVERGRRASHGTVLAAHEALRTGVAIKHGGGSHQGGGTAELFAADPDAFTLSLHGARNYPFRRVPSDLDIDLPSGTTDTAYLTALDGAPHAVAYLVLKFCASRKKQTTLPSLLA